MPASKKRAKGSFRRPRHPRRGGDFFAVGLLVVVVAGMGWLWWIHAHPGKPPGKQPKFSTKPAVHVVQQSPETLNTPAKAPVSEAVAPKPAVKVLPAIAPFPVNFPHPVRNVLQAQVALARRVISPGGIDSVLGSQTRAAIAAFQRSRNLPATGELDANTCLRLTLDAPALTNYVVTTEDLSELQPLGKTWLAKSEQTSLAYQTILELVAEKAHAYQSLIRKLNPAVDWANVPAGTVLTVPAVTYPEPPEKAAFVVIHLSRRILEAFDARTNLLMHCPCSIAAKVEKRPVGELHVVVVAPHPNYTVNPDLFPESAELKALGHKLILPPGPNNPVGVAWIGLDRPGYGMHGTPVPEHVGRTESHGCFRLANWDAAHLVKLVWIGMPVEVVP